MNAAPAAPVGAASVLPSLPAPNAAGLTLRTWPVAAGQSERLGDASVTTAAVFAAHGGTPSIDPVQVPVRVRILLPEDYQRDPAHPYPVLYLLHGGSGDVEQWSKTDEGNVTAHLKDSAFKGIVVMPEGGKAGWYSDWPGHTDGFFAPQWETFHVRQLVPWTDANFNTVRAASGRAVAGVSMGGYGALRYAGRNPDLFSAVGAFSPGTDIYDPGAQSIIANSTWQAGASILWTGLFDGKFRVTGDTPYRMATVFGPPSTWPGQPTPTAPPRRPRPPAPTAGGRRPHSPVRASWWRGHRRRGSAGRGARTPRPSCAAGRGARTPRPGPAVRR
ncbi:alpha/beta hydrolase-fold protein [Streptomyces sp. NBC_01298]|uniref:alpha/beta hydrolase n=1 Tax=Streptomyces sp. NBC_01298 TaxID=2903817 RepID=UPI002E10FD8A|nr:alpha/beta hydrolase-fold protein [Streptomyces sp. NBC_01298]